MLLYLGNWGYFHFTLPQGLDIVGAWAPFIPSSFPAHTNAVHSVLRSLCNNPDGLFWAGDTAQTIAVGSSFKFNELKATMYSNEVRSSQHVLVVSLKIFL